MHESKSPENQYMKVILLRKKNQCINTSGSGDWARLEGDLEVGSAADHRPTLIGLLASLQRKPSLTFPKNYFALELKYKGNISNTKKIYFVCIWPVSDIATGLSSNRLNYRRFRTILTNFTRSLCGRKRTEIQQKLSGNLPCWIICQQWWTFQTVLKHLYVYRCGRLHKAFCSSAQNNPT